MGKRSASPFFIFLVILRIMSVRKIKLKTKDNFEIIGDFYSASDKAAPAAVLSHMMPATKESWKDFAKRLNESGFQCLAIDLRGHGESQAGPDGFRDFSDEKHQTSVYDIESAVDFFAARGVVLEKIFLVGASIGANLSLKFQLEHPEIKAAVLLSPGLNYYGVETEKMAKKINEDQAIFLAAGGENDDYSSETSRKLFNITESKNKKIKIFENAGHGTTIFKEEPALMSEIVSWLMEIYF